MTAKLMAIVRQHSNIGSPFGSPGGGQEREGSLLSKVLNDKLLTLLDAISDAPVDNVAALLSPTNSNNDSREPQETLPKITNAAPQMEKGTALEEMLKMALTDPDPDASPGSPASGHRSPAPGRRSPTRSPLGSPLRSPLRSPLGRRRDKNYVERVHMAERVTSQLLSLVTKEVLPIQLLCIKILWALSTDAPAAKEIAAKGGLRFLLRLLHEGGSPTNDHRGLALDALQSFATSNGRILIAAGGVKVLMDVARFGDRHIQIKVGLCLRNLVLKDANDIVSFGTLIEVQSSSGNATSEASKLSEGSGGALPSKGSVRDNWPGFLSILQAAGIYFEVPCHNDAESPSASKSTSPHASGIVSWKDAGGFVVKDDDMVEVVQDPDLPRMCGDGEEGSEPWHRLRPQQDAAGVKALWRVEGVAGSNGQSKSDAGFVPSILFVAYRFGFEQGSEKLLLRLVREAIGIGWRVTVFAISLKKVPALEGVPDVTITSDAKVLDRAGAFDLMCIHVCDMRLLNPGTQQFPLRFLICPTNSTAGIAGLRKPSRMANNGVHDPSINHLGVQQRSKSGCCTMHDGPPPLIRPAGVQVDLVPMPSASNLLDELRGKFKGMIKIHLFVEHIQNYPFAASEMVMLTVAIAGEEIFRSTMHPLDPSFAEAWDEEISCQSLLEGDGQAVVFTVVGLEQRASSAATSRPSTSASRPMTSSTTDRWRETPLASASCTINVLRTHAAGKTVKLKLKHAGEAFGKAQYGSLSLRTKCRWIFEMKDTKPKRVSPDQVKTMEEKHLETALSHGAGLLSHGMKTTHDKEASKHADLHVQKAPSKRRQAAREKDRAVAISDGKYYMRELERMRELVVKEHEDKKEARTMRIERQVKAKQAAALRKLSLTHHHLDD